MNLRSVYDETPYVFGMLYELLAERTPEQSISHKAMPAFPEHCRFVESRPYQHWYICEVDGLIVGAIYLTKRREVGIAIFKKWRGHGHGDAAMAMLRDLHPGPLLANVAPANEPSKAFFESLGAELIQHTYRLP